MVVHADLKGLWNIPLYNNMFNNSNPQTNGEHLFYTMIKDKIDVIFDIGCRDDSEFTTFEGEVHYFDPVSSFIENLSKQPNKNKKAYFNTFGLGSENKTLFYYPRFQSFYDRIASCSISDDSNKVELTVKRGKDYVMENGIKGVDFLKIDTEGYELHVLQGFEDYLQNVKIVQFEYGGTFLDNNTKLIDVIQHLTKHGFHKFSYLTQSGIVPIVDMNDHYQYCNIVCTHQTNNIAIMWI